MKKRNLWVISLFTFLFLAIWLIWLLNGGCSTAVNEGTSSTTSTTTITSTTTTLPFVSLDPTFGSGGVATYEGGHAVQHAVSMTVDSSGEILVVGYTDSDPNLRIWRFKTDGSLDGSFGGGDGMATDSRGSGNAITIDSAGKILVTGQGDNGSGSGLAVWRFNAGGTIDNTFGTNGMVVDNVNYSGMGKSIIAGSGKIIAAAESNGSAAIWIYNSKGSLEVFTSTAPTGGWIGPVREDEVFSATLDSTGRILVTGSSKLSTAEKGNMAIWRFGADGSFDKSTFYTDSDNNLGLSIFSDSSGLITVVGENGISATWPPNLTGPAIWRYDSDLNLIRTFGNNGLVGIGLVVTISGGVYIEGGSNACLSAIDSSKRILLAGQNVNTVVPFYEMVLWRYNFDGTPDNSFGSNGKVIYRLGANSTHAGGRIICLDPSQRIIVAGEDKTATTNQSLMLWRFK